MGYIFVKALPNYIPVSTDSVNHYCDLDFMIYYQGGSLTGSDLMAFQGDGEHSGIHKGPRVVVTAKIALLSSIRSDDALCLSNDIPVSGYAYDEPEGWECSHEYEAEASRISFIFRPPAESTGEFSAASVKVRSFFTTAQAGVCVLDVRTENFSKWMADVQDAAFTIAIGKKYGFEILSFAANGMSGAFFLNHNMPVAFQWDMVCDTDTEFVLLEDDCRDLGAQGFSGEMKLSRRNRGDHTYTLKILLPEGDKTKSIMIRDTRWRRLGDAVGIAPDFSKPGRLLEYQHAVYLFEDNRVYRSCLSKGYVLAEWELYGSYDGDILFRTGAASAICDGKLYVLGGKKKGDNSMYYVVCDLTEESGSFQEYDTGQVYTDMDTPIEASAACDICTEQPSWMVYAYEGNHDGYLVFCVYDASQKLFPARFFLEMEGVAFFEIGIRNDVLYVALAVEDGIIIRRMKKGEMAFADGGKIEPAPKWMKWIRGNNKMFLLTDSGLYRGNSWVNVEEDQPFQREKSDPWCGASKGKIIALGAAGDESGVVAAWATDVL